MPYREFNKRRLEDSLHEDGQFAILSAWRPELQLAANRALLDRLHDRLYSAGISHSRLHARWRAPDGRVSCAPVYLVRRISLEDARAAAHGAFIHGTISACAVYGPDGSRHGIGDFNPVLMVEALSKLRGNGYAFVGFECMPNAFVEALWLHLRKLDCRNALDVQP